MSDLAILTKKKIVTFQEEDGESKSITLYPFGFQYFNDAIGIINKYYGCYLAVKEDFRSQQKQILDSECSGEDKAAQLDFLASSFDEVGEIIKNVMATNDKNLGQDISRMISFCCRKEIDFNVFHWGEVGALLAAVLEVNMDFFNQNVEKIDILKQTNSEEQKPEMKDGELELAS
jgi:hypothetical protein